MGKITYGLSGVVTLGIDCDPFSPRPDTHISVPAEMLGYTVTPPVVTKLFGAWTWEFANISLEFWEQKKPDIITYFKELYHSGQIRGAEHYWSSALEVYIKNKITVETIGLVNLTPEFILSLLSKEEHKELFTTDFNAACTAVDNFFEAYLKSEAEKQLTK